MRMAINKLEAETIFHSYHLKKTKSRVRVLTILASKDMAIARPVIARKMKDVNRATLYGVLLALEAKGVIYKIFDLRGTAHYAICSFNQNSIGPPLYMHFNCLRCKKIYCLNEPDLPLILLPAGFKTVMFILCIKGTCRKCNKKLSNKIQ